jgi:hypothetical protein
VRTSETPSLANVKISPGFIICHGRPQPSTARSSAALPAPNATRKPIGPVEDFGRATEASLRQQSGRQAGVRSKAGMERLRIGTELDTQPTRLGSGEPERHRDRPRVEPEQTGARCGGRDGAECSGIVEPDLIVLAAERQAQPGRGLEPDDIGLEQIERARLGLRRQRQQGRENGRARVTADACMDVVIVKCMTGMAVDESGRRRIHPLRPPDQHRPAGADQRCKGFAHGVRAPVLGTGEGRGQKVKHRIARRLYRLGRCGRIGRGNETGETGGDGFGRGRGAASGAPSECVAAKPWMKLRVRAFAGRRKIVSGGPC